MAIYKCLQWKLVFTISPQFQLLVQGQLEEDFTTFSFAKTRTNGKNVTTIKKQVCAWSIFPSLSVLESRQGGQVEETRGRGFWWISNLGKLGLHPAALHCVRELPGWFDNQIHIHKSSVSEHRHVNCAFLLQHSSKAPVLIIRQPYKREVDWLLWPSPVYTWLMAVNWPQSARREGKKLRRQTPSASLSLCFFLFSSRFLLSVFSLHFIPFYFDATYLTFAPRVMHVLTYFFLCVCICLPVRLFRVRVRMS